MNFIVIVTCAVVGACPLQGELRHDFKADNIESCRKQAASLISHFGYNPRNFKVTCERK